MGGCREERHIARVKFRIQFIKREHVVHIALVVLEHKRHIVQIHAVVLQVLAQVLQTFQVFGLTGSLGIRHKDNAIYTTKHKLTGTVIIDLTGNRIKLESSFEPLDIPQVQRQKVKKERTVTFSSKGHHVGALVLRHLLVDHLQIGGLSTKAWSVVNDFTTNFSCSKIYRRHYTSLIFLSQI